MLGPIIGDLAAWTYRYDREKFDKQLVSHKATLSYYGKRYLCVYNHMYADTVPSMDVEHWQKLYGTWQTTEGVRLMEVALFGRSDEQAAQWSHFENGSCDKDTQYAAWILGSFLWNLQQGKDKDETLRAQNYLDNFPQAEIESPHGYTLRSMAQAWDSFYRSNSFEEAIRNAMEWPVSNRQLVACLTGALAGAFYGVPSMLEYHASRAQFDVPLPPLRYNSDWQFKADEYARKHNWLAAQYIGHWKEDQDWLVFSPISEIGARYIDMGLPIVILISENGLIFETQGYDPPFDVFQILHYCEEHHRDPLRKGRAIFREYERKYKAGDYSDELEKENIESIFRVLEQVKKSQFPSINDYMIFTYLEVAERLDKLFEIVPDKYYEDAPDDQKEYIIRLRNKPFIMETHPDRDTYLDRTDVVGMQYSKMLPLLMDDIKVGMALRMVRRPDNKYDHNAIAVCYDKHRIGWIPMACNEIFARLIDGGHTLYLKVVDYNHEDKKPHSVYLLGEIYMLEP